MPHITDSKLLQEIISSEISYKDSLDYLINILDEAVYGDTVAALNISLKQLQLASKDILRNLNDTMSEISKEEPDIMRRAFFAEERTVLLNTFFGQLTLFLPVFTDVQRLLTDAKPESGIGELNQRVADSNLGMGINSIIIQPIQRAMRYELLLKELMKDENLDNIQQGIVKQLLKKTTAFNEDFNEAQNELEMDEKAKEKAKIGYEFGDITRGQYTFGSFFQRMKYTLGGSSASKKEDDTITFELMDEELNEEELTNNVTNG